MTSDFDPHTQDDLQPPPEERKGPPGLTRVGTIVEQVRPIARVLLDDQDPTEVGIKDLRGNTKPTHPGDPADVFFVFACAGDVEIEFVWKRAIEGDCLERLATERQHYLDLSEKTRRIPTLYAEMSDSDEGGGIAIEHLTRMAMDVYEDGEPSQSEIGKAAAALAELAADVPVTGGVQSYLAQVLEGHAKLHRPSLIWKFVCEVFAEEGARLDDLPRVMSPGFSPQNVGFREGDPLPVFFDLDTLCARPIGSGLITGLVFRPDFDALVPVILASIPQLTAEDIYLLALGQVIEHWGAGDPRGRPIACSFLDALGIAISEEIRTS